MSIALVLVRAEVNEAGEFDIEQRIVEAVVEIGAKHRNLLNIL